MRNAIDLTGQWIGYFTYGQEYGDDLVGEKVMFRLFVENFKNEEFVGTSIDLEGVGAIYENAKVKGFIEGNFISFTKEYPHFYGLDEAGNNNDDKNKQHPVISYSGKYNKDTEAYSGQWELRMEIKPVGDYWLEDICTGTWEIRRD